MLSILLIEANQCLTGIDTLYPPLQLAYLASYVSNKTVADIRIISRSTLTQDDLDSCKPDIVGIASISQNYSIAKSLANQVKQWKQIPVVMGGHHVSSIPETMTDDMDVAVIGEGEKPFAEIVMLVESKCFSKNRLRNILGVAFKEGKDLFISRRPISNKDLDWIPVPNRDLIGVQGNSHIVTSRGCPFKCSFCSSSHFWNNIRYHSAERVCFEIIDLVTYYGVSVINIYDDLFACKKERLQKILDILDSNNDFRSKGARFTCLARADVLDDEIATLLRRIGVGAMALGLESGSERILKYLKGQSATVDHNIRAAAVMRNAGFQTVGSVIIGSPGETQEDAEQTLAMLRKIRLNCGEAYVATPFPGTEFWNHAIKSGTVGMDMEWNRLRLDFNEGIDGPIIISDKMNRSEVFDYWKKANAILSGAA